MEGKIDIKALLIKLTSKWYYFLIVLLITLPLTYAYIEWTDPIYQVQSSILLNGEVKNGMNSEKFLKGMELMNSHTELEDEIGILGSFTLAESTVKKLDFGISYYEKGKFKATEKYGNERAFVIEMDSSSNQVINVPIYISKSSDSTFRVRVSEKEADTYNFYTNRVIDYNTQIEVNEEQNESKPFQHPNLKFTIHFDKSKWFDRSMEYYFTFNELGAVADSYKKALEIKPISRESNIVEINLTGTIPTKEIKFLNKMMDVYLSNELQKKNVLGVKTINFIDDQLSGVSDELKQAEGSLESFRSRNNILNITTTAENLTRNLEKLESDRSVLDLKLKYYKYIAGSVNNGAVRDIGAPSTFGLEDALLNNMIMELARLNQERVGLNYSSKEGNPVAEVIDLKIANQKRSLIQNVNNFLEATGYALADLNSKIADIKRNVQGLPKSERELVSIQRKFDFNDNVYNYLLEKRAEAGIAIASNTVEKAVVDRAKQAGVGPVFPNKKMFMILAFALSLTFTVCLIIVGDLINDHITDTKDLEKNTTIPIVGIITHGNRSERGSTIVANAKTAIGESFRSLRVNLQYLTLGSENNVIGITSSRESEGKTFCSVNLSVAMAQSGKRTVLIDADLRRPRVASIFGLKSDKGLSSYLIGSCALADIINKTSVKGLDVITSGPIPPNPIDLIGLPKMDELINSLKQIYSTIIIDTSPIGYVSEYIIIMKYLNASIYIVRSNYTNRFHLDKINKLYSEKKIKNVSVLLNDVKSSLNAYNYVYGKS
ncbi:tyrosine-protein kinase domain-containing protein [soil metagenome]